MTHLFFETEEQICAATHHLVQPSARIARELPKVRRHRRDVAAVMFSVLRVQAESNQPEFLQSLNLSEAGVFFKTELEFRCDETLLIEFVSAVTQRTVSLLGRVARLSASWSGEEKGIGVDFYDLNDVQRRELRQLTVPRDNVLYAH